MEVQIRPFMLNIEQENLVQPRVDFKDFGYDIIKDKDCKEAYLAPIIDINFFPEFKGVPVKGEIP
jgi:hypothetical protein